MNDWKIISLDDFIGKKEILEKNLIFTREFQDIRPFNRPKIVNCVKVIFHNCHRNFVLYWLDNTVFPNVKKVYVFSDITFSITKIDKRTLNSVWTCVEKDTDCFKNKNKNDTSKVKFVTEKQKDEFIQEAYDFIKWKEKMKCVFHEMEFSSPTKVLPLGGIEYQSIKK